MIPYSASYLRVKGTELAAYLYKQQCFLDNIQSLNHEAGRTAKEITKHTGCSNKPANPGSLGQPWPCIFTSLQSPNLSLRHREFHHMYRLPNA